MTLVWKWHYPSFSYLQISFWCMHCRKYFVVKIFISDQYSIAYYAIIIIIIITIVVVYIVHRVLALSFMLDMWILFIHSLFVLPLCSEIREEEKCSRNNNNDNTKHCKTVVDMAQIPGRIEISKMYFSSFCVINMNESWKMLHTYIHRKKEVTGNTQPIFAKTSNHSESSLCCTF